MDIVALLEELVNGLIAAEDKFFQNPKDFYSLERSVKSTTESFSAAFFGNVLTSINEQIYKDGWRQGKYKVQRTDSRTLISSVGDVTFESTYYRRYSDGTHHYLIEEILGLDPHERFTEEAEVVVLTEALKTSYAEAAKTLPSKQEISKTTVMNKVHGIAEDIPLFVENNPKKQTSICSLKQTKTMSQNSTEDGAKKRIMTVSSVNLHMYMSTKEKVQSARREKNWLTLFTLVASIPEVRKMNASGTMWQTIYMRIMMKAV